MTIARFIPRGETPHHHLGPEILSFAPKRHYRMQWLDEAGDIQEGERTVQANPLVDAAHSAFVRGTLISTACGPIAIEDLLPGDRVVTAADGPQPVLWIGSMTLAVPEHAGSLRILTRIQTDALGAMRPLSDLIVGPGARLLRHPRRLRASCGSEPVLTPARAMADGMQIFGVAPRKPVTLYHICLRQHAIITASGLETESFHPGAGFERGLDKATVREFLSFFPHVETPQDFGALAHMRLPLDMPDALDV
jgi:hypothetical protein